MRTFGLKKASSRDNVDVLTRQVLQQELFVFMQGPLKEMLDNTLREANNKLRSDLMDPLRSERRSGGRRASISTSIVIRPMNSNGTGTGSKADLSSFRDQRTSRRPGRRRSMAVLGTVSGKKKSKREDVSKSTDGQAFFEQWGWGSLIWNSSASTEGSLNRNSAIAASYLNNEHEHDELTMDPMWSEASLLLDDDSDHEALWADPPEIAAPPRPRCEFKAAKWVVRHDFFELGIGFLVLLNALMLGLQVDYKAHSGGEASEAFIMVDALFCTLFMSEMVLRIWVFGWSFFIGSNVELNWFDFTMVVLQASDLLGHYVVDIELQNNLGVVRVLRLLRLARILRVLRAIHLFEELRRIVLSLYQASRTLFWSLVMMFIIVYCWSVFFLQVLVETDNYNQVDALHYWFGSLGRSLLTMSECMLSGVSWDVVVSPLIDHVSPLMGILFVTYVAISLLIVMNLVTGLFVDTVTSNVREDKDDTLAANIRDMLAQCGDEDVVAWEAFEANMQSPEIQAFFRSIDVNPADARLLFDLFDPMKSGCVAREDLINGFLRMRGPAKALDLAMLRSELAEISNAVPGLNF